MSVSPNCTRAANSMPRVGRAATLPALGWPRTLAKAWNSNQRTRPCWPRPAGCERAHRCAQRWESMTRDLAFACEPGDAARCLQRSPKQLSERRKQAACTAATAYAAARRTYLRQGAALDLRVEPCCADVSEMMRGVPSCEPDACACACAAATRAAANRRWPHRHQCYRLQRVLHRRVRRNGWRGTLRLW